jgi:HSP20 family protein
MTNALERWFDRKRLNPVRDFSQIQESFDRLFNDFAGMSDLVNMRGGNGFKDFGFSPNCEISEEDKNYILKFDLPGITKDQIKVEVDGDQISIRAERKEEIKKETKKKYFSEMHYGSYSRSFTFPGPVDEKKISAHFDNGVLSVTVPKTGTLINPTTKLIPVN